MSHWSRRHVASWGTWAVVAAGAVVMACGGPSAKTPPAEPAAAPTGPPTVNVVRVIERPLDVVLDMPGNLEPYEEVAMYPKVTGYVRSIPVDRGSRVRAGEVLAQLEAPELLAQRAEA